MAHGEQRKVHFLLPLIPTLRGFRKHTLPGGGGQQRQARVQAHAIGAVLLGLETQHWLRLALKPRPSGVPHRDSPAGAAAHKELPGRVQIKVDTLIGGHLAAQGPQWVPKLPKIPAQKLSILAGSGEEAIAIGVKAEVRDAPLVSSQQGKRGPIFPGVQAQGAAIGATGVEGLGWAEGYAGNDATLALPFCKRGSDLAVSARPGCGEDTHSPVKATEELGAIRGEAERVGCRQLIQVIVGAKGSPELSSEGIPDVNWVLPAAAGHAERDTDTEAPV